MIPSSQVFSTTLALPVTQDLNQIQRPVGMVGYKADGVIYWVATDRFNLSVEEIP